MTEIPEHLRRFLPEQSAPTPAERFDAYLAEHADDGKQWQVRSESQRTRRTWIGFAVPLGFLAAVIVHLGWRVLT